MWGLLLLLPLLLLLLGAWDEHQITWRGWEDAQSAGWGVDGGSGWDSSERCVWHLIFLTMKDDSALADANFTSDGEKCLIVPNLELRICARLPSSWKSDEYFNPPPCGNKPQNTETHLNHLQVFHNIYQTPLLTSAEASSWGRGVWKHAAQNSRLCCFPRRHEVETETETWLCFSLYQITVVCSSFTGWRWGLWSLIHRNP